jgi:hypothetical protein
MTKKFYSRACTTPPNDTKPCIPASRPRGCAKSVSLIGHWVNLSVSKPMILCLAACTGWHQVPRNSIMGLGGRDQKPYGASSGSARRGVRGEGFKFGGCCNGPCAWPGREKQEKPLLAGVALGGTRLFLIFSRPLSSLRS